MAKYAHVLQDKNNAMRPPGGHRTLVRVVLVLTLLASPLIYEGGRVVFARWQSMMGTYTEVETPVWNQITAAYQSAVDEWDYRVGRNIAPGKWSADMAVPAVIIVAIGSTFFLRNTTR
ncbi:MAG: hypothetical protein K2X91_04280 [Thermoleophilia bacterium]|nr:hypothetical protein [Thermoleophilia bacterium]